MPEIHLEWNNTEGKMLMKAERTAATTSNTATKHKIAGKTKVNEKEMEPHETTDCAMANGYPTMIRKEKKTKPAVKSHQYIKECK